MEANKTIRLESYAAARDRVEALLCALRCWDEHNAPDNFTLYCIADLISELLPTEDDFELLDRYHNQRSRQA